jgi:hypothetical protein
MHQHYLNRLEAATFLTNRGYKTAPATLAKRAVTGGGPLFISWGRKPLYEPAELLRWAEGRCTGPRRSTSDTGGAAADLQRAALEPAPLPALSKQTQPPENPPAAALPKSDRPTGGGTPLAEAVDRDFSV